MSENYRKMKDAVIVAVLAVFLCVTGRQYAVPVAEWTSIVDTAETSMVKQNEMPDDALPGTDLTIDELEQIGERMPVVTAGAMSVDIIRIGTALETVVAGEVQTQAEAAPLTDLTGEFAMIRKGVTKEMIGGYPVDDTFLLWFGAQYGDDAIRQLAEYVRTGGMEPACWQELTGSTMHALWMEYCRDTGYQRELLLDVQWVEESDSRDDGTITLGFAGDTDSEAYHGIEDAFWQMERFAEDAEVAEAAIAPGISAELFAKMQETDVVLLNHEFTNAPGNGIINSETELTGSWTDVRNGQCSQGTWYYMIKGRKIAVVSLSLSGDTADLTQAVEMIADADQTSDTVIVLVRWGVEGNLYPDSAQTDAARAFVAAGADAIVGGHAHRLQGVGYISGVPVAYSLGSLRYSNGLLYTAFLSITIGEDGALRLSYTPCMQEESGTRLLTAEESAACCHYLMAVSSGVGMDADGVVWNLRAGERPDSGAVAYDSAVSRTSVCGMGDVHGVPIDPAGNYKEL